MKSISVIIPTYNRAHSLGDAIDSALNQTLPPDEIIVVDDASTDNTDQVLARYSDRIRVLRNQTNQGASRSRNLAVQASHGDYIAFLDSDDIFLPKKLALQMDAARKHPDACVIGTGYWLVDQQNRVLFHAGGETPHDPLEKLLIPGWTLCGAALIKRAALISAGGFDEAMLIAEDYELWSRIALQGYDFYFVDQPLLWYRVQAQSLTSQHSALLFTNEMRVITRIIQEVPRIAMNTDLADSAKSLCHLRAAIASGFRNEWERCDAHLGDAFALKPAWIRDTTKVQDAILAHTANPFNRNTLHSSEAFLQHLAQAKLDLSFRADALLARIYIHAGLLSAAIGDMDEGTFWLNQAKQRDPERFASRSEELAPSMLWLIDEMEHAEARARLECMLTATPASQPLRQALLAKVLSDYHLRNAFRHDQRGQRGSVFGEVRRAVAHRPSLICNRGVLALLGRSAARQVASPFSHRTPAEMQNAHK
jgi:GT2 family glycosyltransferase